MNIDSTASNVVTAPQPQSMSDDANYDLQLAEFKASPLRRAAANISACSLVLGGVGLCVVTATLGNAVSGLAGGISGGVSLGLCCLSIGCMEYADVPSDPNDPLHTSDG